MQTVRTSTYLVALCLGLLHSPAPAQDNAWQQPLDVLSAGAAAAIVLLHICQGPEIARQAATYSAKRFDEEATRYRTTGHAPAAVRAYLQEASEIKVKALWQANSEKSCSELAVLRDMGLSTGFLVANSSR